MENIALLLISKSNRINIKICFVFRDDTEGCSTPTYFVRPISLLFLQKTSQILHINHFHPVKCEMQTRFYKATSHILEPLSFLKSTLDEVLLGWKAPLPWIPFRWEFNSLFVPFSFNTATQATRESKAQYSDCSRLREESQFSQPFQLLLKSIITSHPEMMPTLQNVAGFSITEAAAVPVCWIKPVPGRWQRDLGALRCKACKLGG